MLSTRSSGKKSRKSNAPTDSVVHRNMLNLTHETRIIRRVLSTAGTVTTNVSGFFGVLAITNSSQVNSCPGWSTVSGSFQEYRVPAIEVLFFPVVNANVATANAPPNLVTVCTYSSGVAPSAFQQVAEGPNTSAHSSTQCFKKAATFKGFGDGQLWTAVSNSIASTYTYGISLADPGTAPASSPSTVYMRYLIKFLVEFRHLD